MDKQITSSINKTGILKISVTPNPYFSAYAKFQIINICKENKWTEFRLLKEKMAL